MTDVPHKMEDPQLPFPIFQISSRIERYMLYDIDMITWLRKTHHILGILIGTLPQIPQQNVFLGLPLELMPEEARLLVEDGLAYVITDNEWHNKGMKESRAENRRSYRNLLTSRAQEAMMAAERKKLESTEKALSRLRLNSSPPREPTSDNRKVGSSPHADDTETLFASFAPDSSIHECLQNEKLRDKVWAITPTTSNALFPLSVRASADPPPKVKSSAYAVFKRLHDNGYYMSPGLRFGCQFMAYPGDPLRYHSHFLVWSADWDEDIDLIDLIGGGRLGTGVKKGFLIGGVQLGESIKDDTTRTFCLEWAGM